MAACICPTPVRLFSVAHSLLNGCMLEQTKAMYTWSMWRTSSCLATVFTGTMCEWGYALVPYPLLWMKFCVLCCVVLCCVVLCVRAYVQLCMWIVWNK